MLTDINMNKVRLWWGMWWFWSIPHQIPNTDSFLWESLVGKPHCWDADWTRISDRMHWETQHYILALPKMPNLINQIVECSAKVGFSLHKCQGCKGQEQAEGCSRLEETKEAWGQVGHVILDWSLLTKGHDSWDGQSHCPGWGLTQAQINPNFLTLMVIVGVCTRMSLFVENAH